MRESPSSLPSTQTFDFEQLCTLVDLPSRTVRYYIQMGLVDRPQGQNRGARYTARHLEQLLAVKKWQAAGLSLERIRDLIRGDDADLPPPRRPAGSVEVWSRLRVAPGIELGVEAGESGLSPQQVRRLFRSVMKAWELIRKSPDAHKEKDDDDA